MDFSEIINNVKSGVVHLLFLNPKKEKIGSGSGFLSKERLITCDHVISQPYPEDTVVHIRFEDSDKSDYGSDLTFGINDLRTKIESASPESQNDFCVINIPEIKYDQRYNFEISPVEEQVKVGREILFMGYPFDHQNLVSHRGYISSVYKIGEIDVIQLDASVNASNSGGPLIEPYSKKVIGIITRKETSLGNDFNALISAFEENIKILSQPNQGSISIGGVDLRQALLMTQNQLRIVATKIKRSSNAGIGFAFGLPTLI